MDAIQEGVMLRIRQLSLILLLGMAGCFSASPAFAIQKTGFQTAGTFHMGIVNGTLVKSKKLAASMKIPVNIYKEQGGKEAQKTFKFYKSAAFQEKLAHETERIKNQVFKGLNGYYKDLPHKGKPSLKVHLPSNQRLYLFISSSIPEPTLRTYTEQLAALQDPNIVIVMRGFIDGMEKIGPTLHFIGKILAKDPACGSQCGVYAVNVEVDPLLFRRYGIEQVPAVVYVPDIQITNPGSEGIQRNATVSQWYTFYGDVALQYSLKRINEEAKSASLEALVKNLGHGFYK